MTASRPRVARHPLVRSFLRTRRTWSPGHVRNSVGKYDGWTDWLAERSIDLVEATRDDCATYLEERSELAAGSTVHKEYQLLRWLYAWLREEEELPLVRKAGRDVEQGPWGPMTGVAAPTVSDPNPDRVRRVEGDEYRRLMASLDKRRLADCRDGAILSLMYWSGLRRHEVAAAELDRLVLETSPATLEILGKGGKWRTVPLAEETVTWVERYLRRRGSDGLGALFCGTRAVLDGSGGHMTPGGVRGMLERRCERAGVKVSCHMFRRAATSEMRRRGIEDTDVATIQGWAPSTAKLMLARYTRNDATELAVAAFGAADPTARKATRRRAG